MEFNRLKYLIFVVVFLSWGGISGSFAQEAMDETPCMVKSTNKKIARLIRKAENVSSTEKYKLYKQAIEIDENCIDCYFKIAKTAYYKALLTDNTKSLGNYGYNSFVQAKKNFKKVINLCTNYHSDPYYYLGVLAYRNSEREEAYGYFKKFLDFNEEENFRYATDYDTKYEEVKKILPELQFYIHFYNNPVNFDPVLVDHVSSEDDEIMPTISPDSRHLYFTRKKDVKDYGEIKSVLREELTRSSLQNDGSFDDGHALPKPFRQEKKFSGISVSLNNREVFVSRCDLIKVRDKNYNNCDIYSSQYTKEWNDVYSEYKYTWTPLKNLGYNVNTRSGWEGHPSISPDGKTLYFSTNRPGSDDLDIYSSERKVNGEWSEAKSIGPWVNTLAREKAPFVHPDGKTMYFAGECFPERLGAGKYDFFVSRKDSNGVWKEPINLGYPINTEENEHSLIVDITGDKAYFSSNNYGFGSSGYDVFSFNVPNNVKPSNVTLIRGKLIDDRGLIVTNATVDVHYMNDKRVESWNVDTYDGQYAVVVNVEKPQEIVITVDKEDFTFTSKRLLKEEFNYAVIDDKDIVVYPVQFGKPYRMNDILYELGSAELKVETKKVLELFLLFLNKHPDFAVIIQGHTDNVGNDEDNLALSKNRALGVKQFLVSMGVEEHRLKAEGFGESVPLVKNDSEENRAINRRTDFVIELID